MEEKDVENYIPEDDLICVRLSEDVLENIEIDVNEDANKNINNAGLDFLEDGNDNTDNNNKQSWLYLLDLNNIYSDSSNIDSTANNNQNIQNYN